MYIIEKRITGEIKYQQILKTILKTTFFAEHRIFLENQARPPFHPTGLKCS